MKDEEVRRDTGPFDWDHTTWLVRGRLTFTVTGPRWIPSSKIGHHDWDLDVEREPKTFGEEGERRRPVPITFNDISLEVIENKQRK